MSSCMEFDYYYGMEAEQFSFYRVPRILIKDERFRGLSSDAKLLYGLMLDRMSLSMKNGWLDGQNRAYIYYTLDNIMDDLGCGREKCVKILAELDNRKGIGLIEKKRQGLGRPDIIYVKNFATIESGMEQKNMDGDFPDSSDLIRNEDIDATGISAQDRNGSADISLQDGCSLQNIMQGKDTGILDGNISVKAGVVNDNGFSVECVDCSESKLLDMNSCHASIKAGDTGPEGPACRGREIELAEVGKSNFCKSENRTSGNMAAGFKAPGEEDFERLEAGLLRESGMKSAEVGKSNLQKSGNRTSRSLEIKLAEVRKPNFKKSENRTSGSPETELLEVGKPDFWKSENQTSGSRKTELAEVGKSDSNYIEESYTEWNNTEKSHNEWSYTDAGHMELNKKETNNTSFCDINPINQSYPPGTPSIYPSCQSLEQDSGQKTGRPDKMEKAESYMELIKKNIEYDHFMQYGGPEDKELFDNLYGVICSVVCADCETVRISGASYPHEMVKSRFLKLNRMHMEYVMHCLGKNTGRVYNINEYMKASLFNAPNTIDSYYQQEVRHDMYGGGWSERGGI